MPKRDLVAEYQADPHPFGRLRPIRFVGQRNAQNFWLFQCACGAFTEVPANKVKPGCTQSCGCFRRERFKGRTFRTVGWNRQPVALTATFAIYQRYKRRAESNDWAFELTLEQFGFMIVQPCYICKALPKNEFNYLGEVFLYNGIDRLEDDGGGYVDGNVAPCCPDCNYAKRKMSLNQFYRWVSSIKEHQL